MTVLAVVVVEVMMCNWIVVNFVLTGLHSYAPVANQSGRNPGKAL